MLDLLLSRYGNIDYVMKLNVSMGVELMNKAMEKTKEERIYSQWVEQLPAMAMTGNFMPFNEYLDKTTGRNIDRRPASVILAELDAIENEFKELKDNGNENL